MSPRKPRSCRAGAWAAALLLAAAPLAAGGGPSRPGGRQGPQRGSQAKGALVLLLLASAAPASCALAPGQDPPEPGGAFGLRDLGTGPAAGRTETDPVRFAADLRSLAGRAGKAFTEILYSKPPGLPGSLEEAVAASAGTEAAAEAEASGAGEDPQEFVAEVLKLSLDLATRGLWALEAQAGKPEALEASLEKLEPVALAMAGLLRTAQARYEQEGRKALDARRSGNREEEIAAVDRWFLFGSAAASLRQTLRWHREHPARILERLQARSATVETARPPRGEEERREVPAQAGAGRNASVRTVPASARNRRAR